MNWKPKPGKVYPALLIKHWDDSFGIELFPTAVDREQEITRIVNRQVRESFPALPTGDCPVPVRAKVVGPGRVAVELLKPTGVEWHEIMVAPQHRKKRRKSRRTRTQTIEIAVPIETDAYGEEALAKSFTDKAHRVETLPDGTQQITLKPGEFEIIAQQSPEGEQP